jgi:3-methyladenine DNA glycosylase AlkC
MEPFKNLINPALVRSAAKRLHAVHPSFQHKTFEQLAVKGLEALELKARVMQVAQALQSTMPHASALEFAAACDALERSLAPPVPVDGIAATRNDMDEGLAGWIIWPLGEFVAVAGMQHPKRALQALHALTQRLTAEFPIRPLIHAHPALAYATLMRWTKDPSPHVRRLASEGSRPRLPWGLRLQSLVQDPSPTLPILAALQDDPSDYVRRSVANHLNDIAKDHPDVVVQWVKQHLRGASAERTALLKHASRSLIKDGHAPMLALWGAGQSFLGSAKLKLSPSQVTVGDTLALAVSLASTAKSAQKLVVDYAVHHVKANGSKSPKVFKGWVLTLEPGARVDLRKQHSLKPVTTRRYHAGQHTVCLQVNGQVVAEQNFALNLGPKNLG